MTEWPAVSDFDSMTDRELLDHGEKVIETAEEFDSTNNGLSAWVFEKRLQAIRNELKRRTENRHNDNLEADELLDDIDGDVREIIFDEETVEQHETA